MSQLAPVLDGLVMIPKRKVTPYLYADKGYAGNPAWKTAENSGYRPRICQKGKRRKGRPWIPKRWVVEAAHSWLNRFRKLLIRYEKFSENYMALLQLAAAIICWRKVGVIYG